MSTRTVSASGRAVAEAAARREAETVLVDMYTSSGISAGDQGKPARAALWFANAARRAEADPDRRRSNAIRARTWGRQAFRPLRAVIAEGSWHIALVIHPGGRYLITADVVHGDDWIIEHSLLDLESEQSLPFPGGHTTVPAAAWSPGGNALAVGLKDGDVVVASFPGGDGPTRIPFPPRIRRLVYSTDGRYLAIAGERSARVWDVGSRSFATPELLHPEPVTTLAFDPEGRFLATGCLDQLARLFTVTGDAASPLWPPVPHRHEGHGGWYREFDASPLFVNGGRELITYSGGVGLRWRSVETGAEVRTQSFPEWNGMIASIEPSPDGRYLAVSGVQRGAVRLIDAATGRPVGPVLEHKNTVMCAAFSAGGRVLATSSTDATARLWAVPGGEPLARPLDLLRTVHLVAFAPRGRALATREGELVRLWALPEEGVPMARLPLDGTHSFAALSPDGALTIPTGITCVSGRGLRSTRAYHVATGQPAGPPLRPGGLIVNAAFSPDGRSVATLGARDDRSVNALGTRNRRSEGQMVVVWDWASGGEKWKAALPSEPRALSYRPDGRSLAVLCAGGELLIFNPDDGREALRWSSHDAELTASHWINNGEIGFSPDGRSLLTWGMADDVRIWDADTGRLRYAPLRHRDKCHDLQFSPDGRLMALASYDGSVRVRDLATGIILTDLPAHPGLVYSARFSPDGQLLVTACADRSVRVWDWRAGRLACPPFEHASAVMSATFTPNGRWVLSASDDGTARAWEWRTGKPVTPPLAIKGNSMSLAVTPNGKHAVVGGFLDALTVLDLGELAPDDDDADTICRQAELLAGQQFHEGGGTVNLAADGWIDRWRALRRGSPAAAIGDDRIDPSAATSPAAGESNTSAAVGEPTALDIEDRFDLADALLRAGRIDEAIATGRELVPLLRRIVEVNPNDPSLRHRFALALVLTGDLESYRRACAATLERFDRSEDSLIVEAARACLVGPDAVLDPSVPLRLAAVAHSRDPKAAWSHYVLGLAEFRAGRYDQAVGHLGESLKLGKTWIAAPLNGPVLAMAHHRLGRRDEARSWLKRAHGRPSDAADGAAAVLGLSSRALWWDRVEFQLLLREADTLLLDTAFPPDPFAP
jgi:WD40 repeat protein/tetratricopeptide (TPR) repeat protein